MPSKSSFLCKRCRVLGAGNVSFCWFLIGFSLVSQWFLIGSPFPKTGEEGLPLPGPWPDRKRWALPNRCQTLVFARKRRDHGGGYRRLAMAMTADGYGWPWQMLMCVPKKIDGFQ